jgi:hypothetical protein
VIVTRFLISEGLDSEGNSRPVWLVSSDALTAVALDGGAPACYTSVLKKSFYRDKGGFIG